MSTNIHIIRGKYYADRFRSYRVMLDGKDVGKLPANEGLVIPVESGPHEVSLRIDWCGCEPVTFKTEEGSDIWFECGNSFAGWKMIFILFGISFYRNGYLWLKKTKPNQALERNAYVRHASCGAAVAPATGVAHL